MREKETEQAKTEEIEKSMNRYKSIGVIIVCNYKKKKKSIGVHAYYTLS